MSFSLPAMMMGVRCEACVACMCMPRKRRRRIDANEDPDISLNAHSTAKVLSQKRAAWVFDSLDVRHSSASQFRTSPVSSRSFMVSVPSFKRSFTFCGHSSFHMIGPILFSPDVQTPPVPIPQLYEYPMYCGKLFTSWRT